MQRYFIGILLTVMTLSLNATELKRDGWNLISVCRDVNRSDIDMSGIEEIQAQDGKSIYTGSNAAYSNLEKLTAGYGYWIRGAKGNQFPSGTTTQQIRQPLLRDGWNLMAACEDIPPEDVDMSGIEEIQDQYGHAIYTGAWAAYSDLDTLLNGYGHWVKGAKETLFTAKEGLSIPEGFSYPVINSSGEAVESSYGGYRIQLLANHSETVDPQSNHLSIVVRINGEDAALLHIQSSYLGSSIVVALYDAEGELIGVTERITVNGNEIIEVSTSETTVSEEEQESIDESEKYLGIQIYQLNMPSSRYQLPLLSDSEFNALSPTDKLMVAEKLLATLFYGMEYTELESIIAGGKFMTTLQEMVKKRESNLADVDAKINDPVLYKSCLCTMKTFSNLFHLTMGQAFINRWSAYVLNQTILFSPAYELDTVSTENICNVNAKLINYADKHYSMRFTTLAHMISEDNWRRFRSPEDNGREMLEIYMLDFNDSHVPISAKALQNWYLSGNDNTLVVDTNVNRDPLSLFGTTIYDGFDFYSELVKTDRFVQSVTKRLVSIYFPNYSESERERVVNAIVTSQPETFQDILLQIVFSKEYLFYAQRYMSVEERFLSLVKKFDIRGEGYYYFVYVRKAFEAMKQAAMQYKLGREDTVPMDTYSVASYKSFIRGKMLDDAPDINNDWGWNRDNVIYNYQGSITNISGYIDHLFAITIQRQPTAEEKQVLLETIDTITNQRDIAFIVFSYIVRLSEFYRMDTIGGGES